MQRFWLYLSGEIDVFYQQNKNFSYKEDIGRYLLSDSDIDFQIYVDDAEFDN